MYIVGEGVSRSKGGKDLKKTEHYAMAFGCRHANLYDSTCNSYVEAGEPGYDILSDASTDSEIGDEEWCFEDFKNNPDCYKLDDTSVTKSSLKRGLLHGEDCALQASDAIGIHRIAGDEPTIYYCNCIGM